MVDSNRIFFLSAVAGGSGDITFCAELLSILLQKEEVDSLFLAVCKQAGGDVAVSFLSLKASTLSLLPTLASLWRSKIKAIRLFERRDNCDNPLFDVSLSILSRSYDKDVVIIEPEDQALLKSLWDQEREPLTVAVQCPLRVISSSKDLLPHIICGRGGDTEKNTATSFPLRLVTIREFGQSRFSSLSATQGVSTNDKDEDVDVSAGLGQDELGVFGLERRKRRIASATSTAHDDRMIEQEQQQNQRLLFLQHLTSSFVKTYLLEGGYYACGYFRTVRDALPFGRSISLFLKSYPALTSLLVFLPIENDNSNNMFISFFIRGLISTGMFSSSISSSSSSSPSSSFQLRRIPIDGLCDDDETRCNPSTITIHVENSMELGLPLQAFRDFLAGSFMSVVTGDMTLNEALVNRSPYYYSMEGHKLFVKESLYRLVQERVAMKEKPESIVASFWEFIENRGAAQHLSAAASSSSSSSSSGSGSVFPYSWNELEAAFMQVSTNILAKYGHLGEKICERLLNTQK